MNAVVQEQPMGCGIACVASAAGTTYATVLRKVDAKHASGRGYYCSELVAALRKCGLTYSYGKASAHRKEMRHEGTIVFIARSKQYPAGHYLVRTRRGWMNPWLNYPCITPARAGFNQRLPGKAEWVLFRKQF